MTAIMGIIIVGAFIWGIRHEGHLRNCKHGRHEFVQVGPHRVQCKHCAKSLNNVPYVH